MINALEIRSSIGEFLADKQAFSEFENWFVGHTWNIHKWGDIESQVLAYEISLRIAEYHADALSLRDLRSELQFIANSFVANPSQVCLVRTASSTELSQSPLSVQPAGRPHVTASELPIPR
jgi:hypothetical protein